MLNDDWIHYATSKAHSVVVAMCYPVSTANITNGYEYSQRMHGVRTCAQQSDHWNMLFDRSKSDSHTHGESNGVADMPEIGRCQIKSGVHIMVVTPRYSH